MRIISWVLLALLMILVLLGGFESLFVAYFSDPSSDILVGTTTLDSLSLDKSVETALRGRRATAAGYALGWACLMLFVILGPYRRGAVWAWWAILCSVVIVGAAALLRILTLGITQGAIPGGVILLVAIPALLLDAQRLKQKVESPSA